MNKTFALIFSCISGLAFAQYGPTLPNRYVIYTWDEAKTANPDTIFAISFKKYKLDSLPDELWKFTKLIYLDLSKNRFTSLPPKTCSLAKLQYLILNRNQLSRVDECIVSLVDLSYIDLWDNPIENFPEAFLNLEKLKTIHAEGIRFGPKFQAKWLGLLPQVEFFFDAPCDCKE